MNKTMAPPSRRTRQRGVVMIFCLIVLVILLAGGVAVIRSSNSALFSAGNLAFKRDLLNQGELAVSTVLADFQGSGAMAGASATLTSSKARNYSAVQLATNTQGIPSALLGSDTKFGDVGVITNDMTGATEDVKIRYLIDRMCNAEGAPTSANCVQAMSAPSGGTADPKGGPTALTSSVYRLTIRVSGPRSTQVFMQTSFNKPDL